MGCVPVSSLVEFVEFVDPFESTTVALLKAQPSKKVKIILLAKINAILK